MFTHLFKKRPPGRRKRNVATKFIAASFVFMGLTACKNIDKYDVTFNDRPVYSPQRLFTDYRVSDKALGNCIEQAIEDFEIFTADGLEVLNCSDAGISSLLGLSQFANLRRLKLSNNEIRNLVELSVMTELIEVQLDGNNVIDSVPLTSLPRVERINLADNPALQCDGVAKFSSAIQITLPEHCQS